jgi:hypothetical protein
MIPVPIFQAQANLVLIDVVVREKYGPVPGLKKQDFEVLEDGRPQAVAVFEEHRATDAPQTKKAPPLLPNVYNDFPQYTVASAANCRQHGPLHPSVHLRKWLRSSDRATLPPESACLRSAISRR